MNHIPSNKSNISSNNKQLKSIQTSLASIKEEYKIGTKTITELIEAESELLNVNVNYYTSKKDMILNNYCPKIEVNPETYEVIADGELITCEPAKTLPLSQRYFMY